MALALSLQSSKEDFVLNEDINLDPELQTVFTIRQLTTEEFAKATDFFSNKNNSDGMYFVLRCGLVDWKNLKDAQGKEVLPQKVGKFISRDSLKRLSFGALNEISSKIVSISTADDDDSGKS